MDAEQPPHAAYRFDCFILDLARGALLAADGTELPLRPKSFALLQLLSRTPAACWTATPSWRRSGPTCSSPTTASPSASARSGARSGTRRRACSGPCRDGATSSPPR